MCVCVFSLPPPNLLGLSCFCLVRWFLFGLGRILRWAMNTTGRPLNFFSNSRTNLTYQKTQVLTHTSKCSLPLTLYLYFLELLLLRYRDVDAYGLLPCCIHFSSSQEEHISQYLSYISSRFKFYQCLRVRRRYVLVCTI